MKTAELKDVRQVDAEVIDDTADELTDALYHLDACQRMLAALANANVVRKITDVDRARCNQLAREVREFVEEYDF